MLNNLFSIQHIKMNILPTELYYHIIKYINCPKTFKSISQTNSLLNSICNDSNIQKFMKNKFKRKIYGIYNEEYFVLPNRIKHGEYKQRWLNDNMCINCFYIDGKRFGEYQRWNENGKQYINCHYINDKLCGEYKEWHYNGYLKIYCKNIEDIIINDHDRNKQCIELFICGEFIIWEHTGVLRGKYKRVNNNGKLISYKYIENEYCVVNTVWS